MATNNPGSTQAAQNARAVIIAGEDTTNNVPRQIKVLPDGTLCTTGAATGVTQDVDIVAQSVGDLTVEVQNFPATQTVDGTVDVGNFPTGFDVNNFPATQNVDIVGQSVGNLDVDVQNFPAGFNVNNFPATQNVDIVAQTAGNLDVDVQNFPTGFDVNNFPATQDVDIVAQSLGPIEVVNDKVDTATVSSPNIGVASTPILAANPARKGALLSNPTGGATVYVRLDGGVATSSNHELAGGSSMPIGPLTTAITGISPGGPQTIAVTEFS